LHGLNEEMIKLILHEDKIEEFKNLIKIYDNAPFIAKFLMLFPKEISTKTGKDFFEVERLTLNYSNDLLGLLKKKKILESDIKDILIKLVSGIKFEEAVKIEKADLSFMEEKVLDIIKSKPGLSENAYMGLVMKEFKGKISGNEAMEIIKKVMKK